MTTEPWSTSGGTISIGPPFFADQTISINYPSNNASSGSTFQLYESQNTFAGKGGATSDIPTPSPSEGTAVSYSASTVTTSSTFSFGGNQTVTISAKAPCEIFQPHTYEVDAYANVPSLGRVQLETDEAAPFGSGANSQTISFSIVVSSAEPPGTYVEVVFIQHT